MFDHTQLSLVDAALYGVSNTCETLQVRREKGEKVGFFRCFDYERVHEIKHGGTPYGLMPAALRIAWHVPFGTSFEPW